MTILNPNARLKAVELSPVRWSPLSDGPEHLAGLESEGHAALTGAVGDLGRGLGGLRPHQ